MKHDGGTTKYETRNPKRILNHECHFQQIAPINGS